MADTAVAVTPGTGERIHTQTRLLSDGTTADTQVVAPGGVAGTPLSSAVTVGITAVPLPATALADRKALYVHNNGAVPIYIGGSGVTTSTGIPLLPGTGQGFDFAKPCVLYAISGTAGQNVRVLEAS
jgi:hypothetical protein